MKATPEGARVLVASDNVEDAAQIVGQLEAEHPEIRASTGPDTAAEFEDFKPDVLVLAFDVVEKAQRYSLGLYRQSAFVRQHRHRTILLCSKEELRDAVDLCKKSFFDDYVLHWPLAHDGMRLSMSVWAAARDMQTAEGGPSPQEVLTHARQLGALDVLIGEQVAEGGRRAATGKQALVQAESDVRAAIDGFSRRLAESRHTAVGDVKDAAALAREIERLKQEGITQAFARTAEGQAPIAAWPAQLHERLAPHLDGMRDFAKRARNVRRIVLIVEDDAFARKLIAHALQEQGYLLLFAEDGAKAFSILRSIRPQLILMDINLPDVDGVALLRQVKAVPRLADVPVLMLTGRARREAIAASMTAGAAGFMVKPFTREALVANLQKILPADAQV